MLTHKPVVFETELVAIAGVEPPKKVEEAEDATPKEDNKAGQVNYIDAIRRLLCGRSPLT